MTVRHCQTLSEIWETALAYDQSNILQLPLVYWWGALFIPRLFERLDPLFKVQSLNLVQDNDGADMLWCGCVWYWLRLPHKLCSYWTAFQALGGTWGLAELRSKGCDCLLLELLFKWWYVYWSLLVEYCYQSTKAESKKVSWLDVQLFQRCLIVFLS